MIISQTAAKRKLTYMTACCGEDSDVKESVCWNKELLTLIKLALPHAANASGKLPIVNGRKLIFDIVIDGM